MINILFWIGLFSRLIFYKSNPGLSDKSITILVVFKNASLYIKGCVTGLLSQNDVQEVLLVNDFSNDESANFAGSIQASNLRLIQASEDGPGKKRALQDGIQNIQTDIILLTDVDCQPASNLWAKIMNNHIKDHIEIVLGYSPVTQTSSFLNYFIRFETWMTALQYMSYALAKIPYMGVGRNMAYRLSIAKDFDHDFSILSGDDDLFVSAKANSENTGICLDPNTFVYTQAKQSYADFYRQKRRHMTTSHHYRLMHKISLALFSISQMFVIPLAVILGIMNYKSTHVFTILIIYMFVKWALSFPLLKKFKEENLFCIFPILDISLSLYYWIMSITIFTPMKTWN